MKNSDEEKFFPIYQIYSPFCNIENVYSSIFLLLFIIYYFFFLYYLVNFSFHINITLSEIKFGLRGLSKISEVLLIIFLEIWNFRKSGLVSVPELFKLCCILIYDFKHFKLDEFVVDLHCITSIFLGMKHMLEKVQNYL